MRPSNLANFYIGPPVFIGSFLCGRLLFWCTLTDAIIDRSISTGKLHVLSRYTSAPDIFLELIRPKSPGFVWCPISQVRGRVVLIPSFSSFFKCKYGIDNLTGLESLPVCLAVLNWVKGSALRLYKYYWQELSRLGAAISRIGIARILRIQTLYPPA